MERAIDAVVVGKPELAVRVGELEVQVRRAETLEDAIGEIAKERTDIVILEIGSSRDGLDGLRALSREVEAIPMLAISALRDPILVSEALSAGAAGVIAEGSLSTDLKDAMQILLAGGSYLGKVDAMTMVERLASKPGKDPSVVTLRERDVLRALAEGASARQIARQLDLSERTVNTHISNIYRKLRVNNRVEAVRVAMRLSLVDTDT